MKRGASNQWGTKTKMSWLNFEKRTCATSQEFERNKLGVERATDEASDWMARKKTEDGNKKTSSRQAETNLAEYERR